MTEPSRKNPLGPTGVIAARRVRELRDELNLNYKQLSQRLADAGRAIPPLGLRRIEAEERRIDVDDLVALAFALGVPVVWLLIDPHAGGTTRVATGVDRDPWATLAWLIGRQSLEDRAPALWDDAATSVVKLWHVVHLVQRAREQNAATDIGTAMTADADPAQYEEDERRVLRGLVRPLREFRELGYAVPALPADVLRRAAELGVDLPGAEG